LIVADIILPLAIEGCYTYLLPETSEVSPQVGMRALVPLGQSKIFTGIIADIHPLETGKNEADYKEIVCMLDDIRL